MIQGVIQDLERYKGIPRPVGPDIVQIGQELGEGFGSLENYDYDILLDAATTIVSRIASTDKEFGEFAKKIQNIPARIAFVEDDDDLFC